MRMKLLLQNLFIFFCLSLPVVAQAQESDSKYLAGAVPEVDGKVVFTKDFTIPGMSQAEIYDRMLNWMSARLEQNQNNSRIVFTEEEKGLIVGIGTEWIIFSSSAFSLDQAEITYHILVTCQPERYRLTVERIRYSYRAGKEKFTAEEWIADQYALKKNQTKMVPGIAKWRKKTVDFVDELCLSSANALSTTAVLPIVVTEHREEVEEKAMAHSETTVIPSRTPVLEEEFQPKIQLEIQPEIQPVSVSPYKEILPEEIPTDAIQTGNGKLVIQLGQTIYSLAITANAGGSLGKVEGKPVVFTILSPDQSYEQMEKVENYRVCFYPNGQTEPSLILECRKLPYPAPMEGMPRTYIGEIERAQIYRP